MRVASAWRAAALALAVCAVAGVMLAVPAQAQPAAPTEAYYVDWLEANPAMGTARGVARVPVQGQADQEIEVRFAATTNDGEAKPVAYNFAQTSCQAGINSKGALVKPIDYWSPTAPYLSTELSTRPPACDMLSLEGSPNTRYTVTLSSPVVKPLMAILSLGNVGTQCTYLFDKEFRLLKPTDMANGYFGGGYNNFLTRSGKSLQGKEGHGVIEIVQDEALNSFSWTVPQPEYWHGFTFAFRTTTVQQQVKLCGELPKVPADYFISQQASTNAEGVTVTYGRRCPAVGFLPTTATSSTTCKKSSASGTYAWTSVAEIPCTRVCAQEPLVPEGHYELNAGSLNALEGATRSFQRDCGADFLPSEISTTTCVSVISDAPLQWTPIRPLVCTPAPRQCKEVPKIKEGEKYSIVSGGDDRSLGAVVTYKKDCGRGYLVSEETVSIQCVENPIPDAEIRADCHPVKWTDMDYTKIQCKEAPRECDSLPIVPEDYVQLVSDDDLLQGSSDKPGFGTISKAEGSVITFTRDCGVGFLATKETSSVTCKASSPAVDATFSWTPLNPITCVRLCGELPNPGADYYITDDSAAGDNLQGKTVTFRRNCGFDKLVPEESTSTTCTSSDVDSPLFWSEVQAIPCVDVPDVCEGQPELPESYFEVSREGSNKEGTKEGSVITVSRTCPFDYEAPEFTVTTTCVANRVDGQHTTWVWSKLSREIPCDPLPRECTGKPEAGEDYKVVSAFDNDEGFTVSYTRECGWDFKVPTKIVTSTCVATKNVDAHTTYAWSKLDTIECEPVPEECAAPATAPEDYRVQSGEGMVAEGAIVTFTRVCPLDFKVPTETVSTTCLATRTAGAHTTWNWTPLGEIPCVPVDPVCEGEPTVDADYSITSGAGNRMEGSSIFYKRTCPFDFYEPTVEVSSTCKATRVTGQATTWSWTPVDTIECVPMPPVCVGLPAAANDYSIQSVSDDNNVNSVVTFTRDCGFDYIPPITTVTSTCVAHPIAGAHTTYSWSSVGSIECTPVDPVCAGDPSVPDSSYKFVSASNGKTEGSVFTFNRQCPLDYEVPTQTVTSECVANRVVGQHTTWSWSSLSGEIKCQPVPRECKGKPIAPSDYRIISAEEAGDADDDTDAEGFTITYTRKCGFDFKVPTKTVSSTCEAIAVAGQHTTWAWSKLDTIECEPVPRVCEAPASAPADYTPTPDSDANAVAEGATVTFSRRCPLDYLQTDATVSTTCEATITPNAPTTWSWTTLGVIPCLPVPPVCKGEPKVDADYYMVSGEGNSVEGSSITYTRTCPFDFYQPTTTLSSTCEATRIPGLPTTWAWSTLGSIECQPIPPVCDGHPDAPSDYPTVSVSDANNVGSVVTFTRVCPLDHDVPTMTVTATCEAHPTAGAHTTWLWSPLSGTIPCVPVPKKCRGMPSVAKDYEVTSAEGDDEGFTITYTRKCGFDFKVPTKEQDVSSTCEAHRRVGQATTWAWSTPKEIECEPVPRVCEAPASAPADYTPTPDSDANAVAEGATVTFTRNCGLDFQVPTQTVSTTCEATRTENAHTTWSWTPLGSIECVPVPPVCEGQPHAAPDYSIKSGAGSTAEGSVITYTRDCGFDFLVPTETVSSTCEATRIPGAHTTWSWSQLGSIRCDPVDPICPGEPSTPSEYFTLSTSHADFEGSIKTYSRKCPKDYEIPETTVSATCVANRVAGQHTTWAWSELDGTIPCVPVPRVCTGQPDAPADYSVISAIDDDEGFTISYTRNCGWDYQVPTQTTSSTCEAHADPEGGNTKWMWSKLGAIPCIPVTPQCTGQPIPVSSDYFPVSGAGEVAEGATVTFSRECGLDFKVPTQTVSSTCEATRTENAHTTWSWTPLGEIPCERVPAECTGEPAADEDYYVVSGEGNLAEGSSITFGRHCPPDFIPPTTTVDSICQATRIPGQHTTWAWSPISPIECKPVDPVCDGNPVVPADYPTQSISNGNWVGSVVTFTRKCGHDYEVPTKTVSSTCEAHPTVGANTVWKWSEVTDTIPCDPVPRKCQGKPDVPSDYDITSTEGDDEGFTIKYTRKCGFDYQVPGRDEDVSSTCEAHATEGAATQWRWSKVGSIECRPVPPVCAGQPSTGKDYSVVSVSAENKEGSVITFTRQCGEDFYIPTVTSTSTCLATRVAGAHTSWSWTPVNEIACVPIPPVCNCLPEASSDYRMVSAPLKQEGSVIEYAYMACKPGFIPTSTTTSTCVANRQPGVMTTWSWTKLAEVECVPINRVCEDEPVAPAGYFVVSTSGRTEGSEVTFSRTCGFDYVVPSTTATSTCLETDNGNSFAWSAIDKTIMCVPVPRVCHGKPAAPADFEIVSTDDSNEEGFTITYTRKCGLDFEIPTETASSTCQAIKTEGAATRWAWTPLGAIACHPVAPVCAGLPAAPADYTIVSGADNTAEGSVITYTRQCGFDYVKPTTTVSSTCVATRTPGTATVWSWSKLDSIECKPVDPVCPGLPQTPFTAQGTYQISTEPVSHVEGSVIEFTHECGPDFTHHHGTASSKCEAHRTVGAATTWSWSPVEAIECVPVPPVCEGEPDAPDDYFQVSRSAENAEGSVAIYNRQCGVDFKVPTNTVSSTCEATRTPGAKTTWAWTHVDDSIACVPLPGMCKGKPIVPRDFAVISAEPGEEGGEEGFTITYTRMCGIDYQVPLTTASSRCVAIRTPGEATTYAWTPVGRIKCLPVPAKCEGKPVLPDDSYFEDSVFSDSEGAVVEYSRTCGFDFKAPTTTVSSTCEATRVAGLPTTWAWTPVPELECEPIPRVCAGMPRTPAGYFVVGDVNNAEGSQITYARKCGSGYDSTATSTSTCRVTSTQGVAPTFAWTIPGEIICPNVNTVKACGNPPATPAGWTISSGASNRDAGQSIAYQRSGCSAYGAGATSSTATTTCVSGQWTPLPSSIDCVRTGPCDDIPIPANGSVDVDTSNKNLTVYTYSCNKGFKLAGQHDVYMCHHATMKLTPADQKSHAMPTCVPSNQTARRLLGFA